MTPGTTPSSSTTPPSSATHPLLLITHDGSGAATGFVEADAEHPHLNIHDLGVTRGDGIFEVKDDGIDRQRARLVERPLLGAGNVENGSVGALARVHGNLSLK